MSTHPPFEEFIVEARSQLRRAYAGNLPPDVIPDAIAEAEAWAWEHQRRLHRMANPVGYLYRVGQSGVRTRKQGFVPWDGDDDAPMVEPALPAALAALPAQQASSIWLVKACGWTNVQAAEALDISASTVATHVARGMESLRDALGVDDA